MVILKKERAFFILSFFFSETVMFSDEAVWVLVYTKRSTEHNLVCELSTIQTTLIPSTQTS